MDRKLLPDARQYIKVCKYRTTQERTEHRRKKELLNQHRVYGHNMRVHHRALYHHSHKPTLPGTQTGSHTGAHTYAPGARNVPVPTVSNGTVPVVGHTEPKDEKEAFIQMLNNLEDEEEKRQELGERLYPLIEPHAPELAAKITGLFLAVDDLEEIITIYRDEAALHENINEAKMALIEPVEEQ
ncbi:hypothetical protein GEMRC1_003126 [Eukaryota sp. GEM-RC1]